MAQIFQARYPEYNAQLTSQFMKWYRCGTFVDVTIHAGGERILAHKVILAANSPFFNGVFLDTKKEMTHLYFTDVPFESMKSLIEYMYCGTLVVGREFAAACLQLGDSLRVKGISDVTKDDIIKEPLPVTEKMHNFINDVINKCFTPPQYNTKQIEQDFNHNAITLEDTRMPENSMLCSRNDDANCFRQQQICDTTTEDQITSMSNDRNRKKMKRKYTKKNKINKMNGTQCKDKELCERRSEELPTKMDDDKPEEDYFQRLPIDDENQFWVDTRNATKIPDHNDETKFNTNLFQNTNDIYLPDLPLQSDVAFEPPRSNQIEEVPYQNFDSSHLTAANPPVDFGSKKRQYARNADKIDRETKKQKPPKIKKQLEELEDKYLPIQPHLQHYHHYNNNNNNTEGSVSKEHHSQNNPNEDCEQDASMSEPGADDLERSHSKRGSPPCPPPQEVTKNQKVLFSCSLCHKAYTHKSNYRRHYMVFHKRSAEPVFECSMCNKKFTRSDNRGHHLRKIHGISPHRRE